MDEQLHKENLEKTRYQLGQIIKSWSKVDRNIENTYTSYHVDDVTFVYLHDEFVVIPTEFLLESKIQISHEQVAFDDYEEVPVLVQHKVYRFSLDEHQFTECIPYIEQAYRTVILSKY